MSAYSDRSDNGISSYAYPPTYKVPPQVTNYEGASYPYPPSYEVSPQVTNYEGASYAYPPSYEVSPQVTNYEGASYTYPPSYHISPQVTWTPVTEHGVQYSTPPIGSPPVRHSLPPATPYSAERITSNPYNAAISLENALQPQVSKSILIDSAISSGDRPQVNHTLLMESALAASDRPHVNHTLLMDSVLPSDDSHVDSSLLIDSALPPTGQRPNAGTTLLLEAMRELEE
jgi:hypothetical protein